MKRLIILAAVCAFMLSAAVAQASDVKISGSVVAEARWQENWNFADGGTQNQNGQSTFDIYQQVNTIFEFVANENLKAVLYTRIGTAGASQAWGQGPYQMGNMTTAIAIRRAYLDFNWPDTSINVKAGYLAVTLPNAFGGGSMILDEETTAAVVSGPITDNVGYLLGYGRAFTAQDSESFVDAYIAALPLTFEGFSFTPFAMYGNIGDGVNAANVAAQSAYQQLAGAPAAANFGGAAAGMASLNASDPASGETFDNAYWLGAAFTMDLFDPFVLKADINYGKLDASTNKNQKSGWLGDIALEYKGWDFMTPELFFVYTSGEDGNASTGSQGSERMPILRAQSWAIGSFFFGGDTLLQGSFPGSVNGRPTYSGFWALGLSLKDIQSFAEGLTHTAHFIYAKGTNDKDIGDGYCAFAGGRAGVQNTANYNVAYGRTLTEKDSLIEIDLNTAYKIYDELTLTLDLGYLNLDADKTTWGDSAASHRKGGDAWKVSTGLNYKF